MTLTYNAAHLPESMAVSKDELQRFFKRLRRDIEPRRIRYFACGEYGEKSGRPHYHALLFGLDVSERPLVEQAWPLGFVHSGLVTMQSARYVAGYVCKDSRPEAYGGRTPPFRLSSAGLGRYWASQPDNVRQMVENLHLTVNGKATAIPRYYTRKLRLRYNEESVAWHADEVKRVLALRLEAQLGRKPEGWEVDEELGRARVQHDRDLEALERLRKEREKL